jgi:hypothetical protein
MAKGKSSSGKNYVSKGENKNVNSKLLNSIRAERSGADDMLNKQRAWVNGSNPWLTIENPNKEQTNKRFIRVRMNDLNGGPAKERSKKIFAMT